MVTPVAMKIDVSGNPYGLSTTANEDHQIFNYFNGEQTNNMVDLYKKLAAIMGELGWISKGQTVTVGTGGYDYTSEAQFIAEIRPLLIKHKVLVIPVSCDKLEVNVFDKGQGKVSYLTTIQMTYNLIDAETGQSMQIVAPAQGADSGDKGVYKALTGALKYVMRQAFFIGTGDDPERYNDEGQVVSKENGKSESTSDRGKRMIKILSDQLDKESSKTAANVLRRRNINLNSLPDDVESLKHTYNFLDRIRNGFGVEESDALWGA